MYLITKNRLSRYLNSADSEYLSHVEHSYYEMKNKTSPEQT